jgi:hypothetical protein
MKMSHIYDRILFSFKEEGNAAIFNNMVEYKHYAKQNKSITGGQIQYDTIYTVISTTK